MGNFEIISYIANIVLLGWAIFERITSTKDKADIRASIRIWQHQAKGISAAIRKLTWSSGKNNALSFTKSFSRTDDVGIALDALHEVSESMSDSLYESRFFTDRELKENMRKDQKKDKEEIIVNKKTK